MLSVQDVAEHYGLTPDTVRRKVRINELTSLRFNRLHRFDWESVWACEEGPMPRGACRDRYKAPLMSKQKLAAAVGVSVRTVERWLALGLPTRKVFGNVRCNPHDIRDWLNTEMNLTLPEDWET